jgi:choloylglycine hydrolase
MPTVLRYILVLTVLLSFMIIPVLGCSDFLLNTSNPGEVISGRTIDWFEKEGVKGSFMVEIRGRQWTSISSIRPEQPGLSWKNRYGFVGIESSYPQVVGLPASARPQYVETLNEEGLSAAYLTLLGADYPPSVTNPEKALLYMDVVSWVAGNFRTVDEVKAGLREAGVWCPPELAGKDPLHLVVHDAQGKTLIVEWVKNETGVPVMNFYDGESVDGRGGVLTNDPPYPLQVDNLARYDNSTPENSFTGLPGGPSPQDRFVRLTKLNKANVPLDTRNDNPMAPIVQAFHLLNSVEVIHGEDPVQLLDGGETKTIQLFTQFSLVRDHAGKIYYVKTQANQNIGKIDLKKLDFAKGSYRKLSEASPYPDTAFDFTGSFSSRPKGFLNAGCLVSFF